MPKLSDLNADDEIARLLDWLRPNVPDIDSKTLRGVDFHNIDHSKGRGTVPSSAIISLPELRTLLTALFAEGYDWLNLSGYGSLSDSEYLIGVEYSKGRGGHHLTSVNLSGPILTVDRQYEQFSRLIIL